MLLATAALTPSVDLPLAFTINPLSAGIICALSPLGIFAWTEAVYKTIDLIWQYGQPIGMVVSMTLQVIVHVSFIQRFCDMLSEAYISYHWIV